MRSKSHKNIVIYQLDIIFWAVQKSAIRCHSTLTGTASFVGLIVSQARYNCVSVQGDPSHAETQLQRPVRPNGTPGPGGYVDGNGLMLRVRDSGSRSWVQRIMIHGRRVDIGLRQRRTGEPRRCAAHRGRQPRRGAHHLVRGSRTAGMAEKAEPGAAARRPRRSATGAQPWTPTCCRNWARCTWGLWRPATSSACCVPGAGGQARNGTHGGRADRRRAGMGGGGNLREPAGSGREIVETVMRSLPKAAAVRHHRALHFSDVADALARVDGHLVSAGACSWPSGSGC